MSTHVAQYKRDIVAQIVKNIEDYPMVGVVNMENLPAPQLQRMREKLRGRMVLSMTKKRLIRIALADAKEKKKGIEGLSNHFVGMPALIFAKENPFSLFRVLKENKSNAPAKSGQVAPRDIVIPAGPTGFAPGPIIGELGALGIKTQVEAGKIAIRADTVVCRQGEQIKEKVAALLTRMGVEPMEVGLDLVAAWEDGVIFTKSLLDIDENKFRQNLIGAHSSAMALAIGISYLSPSTIRRLLAKAHGEAKCLAVAQKVLTDETVSELIRQASMETRLVQGAAGIEVQETIAPAKEEKRVEVDVESTHGTSEVEVVEKEAPESPEESDKEKRKEENPHQAEIADLTKQLLRKGTLRK
jgi:large subunit ribosomal protein L10